METPFARLSLQQMARNQLATRNLFIANIYLQINMEKWQSALSI